MRVSGKNSGTSDRDGLNNGRRSEQVDIQGIKVWAEANLPARSHLCEILLLEKDFLTVDEFLAKMDIWLKLVEFEEQPQI